MKAADRFDDIVLGTGMAGLTVGALLARSGRRVLLLEAHEFAGGYAHSFPMGGFRFCAQVHYVFGCGEGEPVHTLLSRLGLADEVRFVRLDPEGFDQVVVAGERFRIPNGFAKYRDRLIARFPQARAALWRYFALLTALREELSQLPDALGWRDVVAAPLRFPHVLRYRTWTLQRLFDRLEIPPRLQTVLAGQAGDYLLPPEQVALLLHVALVSNYDRGAYYPVRHFAHMIDSLVGYIRARPGCAVLFEREVERILVDDGKVTGVRTRDGQTYCAERYISNIDPVQTLNLAGWANFPAWYRRKLDYAYSSSTFTLYLGVKDCDLRAHGFGSFNVWRYPHDDLNQIYRAQGEHNDLSNPWFFVATPTLHSAEEGLAPAGQHVIEVATSCSYEHFHALRASDPKAYVREKNRIRDTILDILEAEFVPGLRDHLTLHVAGTPLTNAHFCRAPRGNAYGAALTPANIARGRLPSATPLSNLHLVNATAGYPSIGGTVSAGLSLVERLSGGER